MAPAATPTSTQAIRPEVLHIVLFGMPGAGKTALLGALEQAADTQEHLLNGRLSETSNGLRQLQDQLYEGRDRPTTDEVVSYPIHFEPLASDDPQGLTGPVNAALVDCDGRAANNLLRREDWAAGDPDTGLAGEVLDADALVLLIDASAAATQMEADFTEFSRFLRLLEEHRGRQSEVGGMPVFLVLTKCDLLADPKDAAAAWMERIEQRKGEVQKAFTEFLARQEEDPPAFGHIDLHVWATAVKRPPFSNSGEGTREPYGVAELFRQCLENAERFHLHEKRADRRLWWTVGGTAAIVLLLGTLILAAATGLMGGKVHPLQAQLPTREPRAAVRLAGPVARLQRLEHSLMALREDPRFATLPPGDREYVDARLQELDLYLHYGDTLRPLPSPEDVTTEKGLEDLETALKELTVPVEYRSEWGETEAVRTHDERLEDVRALRAALASKNDARMPLGWYLQLKQTGRELEAAPADVNPDSWSRWYAKLTELLTRAQAPPFLPAAKLPNSKNLTYQTVLDFPTISLTRNEWDDRVKPRLEKLRDLSEALGLAGLTRPGQSAPLDVPPPPTFTVADAHARRISLENRYSDYAQRLTLAGLPDESTLGIRLAAQSRYGHLIEAARPLILEHLPAAEGNEQTVARWRKLFPWIEDPRELADWRVLATVLGRLQQPTVGDPVTELATFLKRESFDLDLPQATLEIPDALRIRPTGKLEVYHPRSTERGPALVFEQAGGGKHDDNRRVTLYLFRLQEPRILDYHPGDVLRAQLAVKDVDNRALVLSWARGHSPVYQFERLVRQPILQAPSQPDNADDLAMGVFLQFPADHGVPRLPDLLPALRAKP